VDSSHSGSTINSRYLSDIATPFVGDLSVHALPGRRMTMCEIDTGLRKNYSG
jgi:hypothetical protein